MTIREVYRGFEVRLVCTHDWWQTYINDQPFGQISQEEQKLWRLAKEEIDRRLQ